FLLTFLVIWFLLWLSPTSFLVMDLKSVLQTMLQLIALDYFWDTVSLTYLKWTMNIEAVWRLPERISRLNQLTQRGLFELSSMLD
ncbi:hypothetical protein ERO13_A02G008840v2, partial [Gossypium hirsutum]